MNIQLDNVISDVTGTTGMLIIRAIIAGQRHPLTLARFRNPHCKNSRELIAKSLEGNYREEHIFELRQAVELYDYYTTLIQQCDEKIEKVYAELPHKVNPDVKTLPQPKRKSKRLVPKQNAIPIDLRTARYRVAGVDLTVVDGLSALTVQMILSEIGVDMSPWRTSKHFASWLCLCPHNDISGGKVLRTKTDKTKSRTNRALRLAARSLHHSESALGAYYRRMRAHLGGPKAVTATAHKLARIIYHMLKYQVEYVDLGVDHYEAKHREREIKKLQKKAEKLGFGLVYVVPEKL